MSTFKSYVKSPRYRSARNAAIVALGLILVTVIGILINSTDRENEAEDPMHVAKAELDSFERVLSQGNAEEIVGFLKLITLAPNDPLPIITEKVEQSVKLADQLLEMGDESRFIRFGAKAKLKSLLILLSAYQRQDLDTTVAIRQVTESSLKFKLHTDKEISSAALSALLYARLTSFENDDASSADVKATISEFIRVDPESERIAKELIGITNRFASRQVDVDAFLELIASEYANTKNLEIQKVTDGIRLAFARRDFLIPQLNQNELEIVRRTIVEQTRAAEQAIAMIAADRFAPAKTWQQLSLSVSVLLQSAEYARVEKLLADIEGVAETNQQLPEFERHFASVERFLALLNTDFPNQPWIDAEGNTVELLRASKPNLLFFALARAKSDHKELVEQTAGIFKLLTAANRLGLKVIFVEEKTATENEGKWNSLKSVCEPLGINAVRVSREENPELKKSLPLPWSPCWLLIDKDKKIVELSPALPVLRSGMYRYVELLEPGP